MVEVISSYLNNKRNTAFSAGCGYEYQRYVFLYACTQLQENGYVSFEENEDIEIEHSENGSPHIIIQVKEKRKPIQLKDMLPEINKAWEYFSLSQEKLIKYWYITTQSEKLESPPLIANFPEKTGIEIWNNPSTKEEFNALIKILLKTDSVKLKNFLERERETINVIRDSLIYNISFFCKTPYLEKLLKKIEDSLRSFLEKNGYLYSEVENLISILKSKIDTSIDKENAQNKKNYRLSYEQFQKMIRENIPTPNSYAQIEQHASVIPIDIDPLDFESKFIMEVQSLFENEQKIMKDLKEINFIKSTQEYCQKLAIFLLKVIQIRTRKTLAMHLADINDVNREQYSCFNFADQLIKKLQSDKNHDRKQMQKEAISFLTQLNIFYNRGG